MYEILTLCYGRGTKIIQWFLGYIAFLCVLSLSPTQILKYAILPLPRPDYDTWIAWAAEYAHFWWCEYVMSLRGTFKHPLFTR